MKQTTQQREQKREKKQSRHQSFYEAHRTSWEINTARRKSHAVMMAKRWNYQNNHTFFFNMAEGKDNAYTIEWERARHKTKLQWPKNDVELRWSSKHCQMINKMTEFFTCSIARFVCGSSIDQCFAIGAVGCDGRRGIQSRRWLRLQHNVFGLKILDGVTKSVGLLVFDWRY